MRRGLLAVVLATVWSSLGCGPEIDLDKRPRFSNGINYLTLLIYDGITGAPVEGATVLARVGPHELAAEVSGNAYTISQVPNGTFPVFIRRDGYLEFVATNSFSGTGTLGSSPLQFETKTVQLYPTQKVERDITIKVFDSVSGSVVSGGTVIASLKSITDLIDETTSNRLTGSFSFRPSVITGQLANGVATLPQAQLVFGAEYTIDVFGAKNADGSFLTPKTNLTTVRAGFDFPQVTVMMGLPARSPMALWANNEKGDAVNTELLEVRFPYPVEFCNESGYSLSVSTTGTEVANATDSVVERITGEGTITLTPDFGTTRDYAHHELKVTFNNVQLRVKGASNCVSLDSIPLRESGRNVSTTIDIDDP